MAAPPTLEDTDAGDCRICCLPLRPPIFECGRAGHTICSSCLDRLPPAASSSCHICRVTATGGYRRKLAMEHLMGCLSVPCPNGDHGCAARPAYFDLQTHARTCPHAPCRCPAEGCGFAGPTASLLDHFAADHDWPCAANVPAGEGVVVDLRDGVNVVDVVDEDADRALARQYLLVLNVSRNPSGRDVSAYCIHPHAGAGDRTLWKPVRLVLLYSRNVCRSGSMQRWHYQYSNLDVACGDLSDGPPPNVRKYDLLRSDDEDEGDTFDVALRVTID